VIFNGVFQFTNASFELFLILNYALQLGWDGVNEVADAGDGATGKKYDEAGSGFLLDAPPKASV
jgi:hypothetical protein